MVEFDHVRDPESFTDYETAQAYYEAIRADAEVRRAEAAEKQAEIAEQEHEVNDELAEMLTTFFEDMTIQSDVDMEDI